MYFLLTLAGVILVIISQHLGNLPGEFWVFAQIVVGAAGGAMLGHVACVASDT